MKPKWQKLASLAQEMCTLWCQFFGAVFDSKEHILLLQYRTKLRNPFELKKPPSTADILFAFVKLLSTF